MDIWKALLGGYILPQMEILDPASIEGNDDYKDLIEKYSKENIEKMFSDKETIVEVDKIVEKIVEVPTIVEKTVIVSSGEKVLHRRLRSKVNKISRKERALKPDEKDLVIKVFNDTQDMVDKTSEVFHTLADAVNKKRAKEEQVSASQFSGYWSSLCRWANGTKARRDAWVEKSIKKGIYTLAPVYTDAFVAVIKANYQKKQEEAVQRQKDHAEIKRTGERRKVLVSQVPAKSPKPIEAIDFSDIS